MGAPTREEVIKSGEVDPEYRKAFEGRPGPAGSTDFFSTRATRAAHLEKLRHLYPIPGAIPTEVTESEHQVPTRDEAAIRVRVYQPVKGAPEGGSPLIVMYHEGGFSMGDLTDEDLNCRMFTRDLGAVCVNVEYRLAPEHPFPIGINDCWDALKWAVDNSEKLKATPSRGLIVGGASAGGNVAAVMALLARDKKLDPPVTGQYLCVPALLPEGNVPDRFKDEYKSRKENVNDPILKDLKESDLQAIYRPDPHSPLYDPFNHPAGHKGIGKAFFQVAGLDPLRDEALLYERLLREENGVPTKLMLYPGYGHMWWTNYPELDESERFVRDTAEGFRWLLEK